MGSRIIFNILLEGQGKDGQIIFQVVQTYTDPLIGFIGQWADINILLVGILAKEFQRQIRQAFGEYARIPCTSSGMNSEKRR